MRAVVANPAGGRAAPMTVELPEPEPRPGEVVIDVAASGVNRADLLQAAGRYPPPPGASEVLGLEAAGTISALGQGVSSPAVGAPVMALLSGGGYAERVAVPAGQTMPVPEGLSIVEAAAVPEAFLTAWRSLAHLAPVATGEWVLVHAAAGGVGAAAVQIARELGARVLGTVRSPEKQTLVRELGATPVLVADGRFAEAVREITGGAGVDVVVDLVGGGYWTETLASLASGARVSVVGLLGGAVGETDLSLLMRVQARVVGSTLRSRPAEVKAALVSEFAAWGLPRLQDGRMRAIVAATVPLSEVADAHALVARSVAAGKVVLITRA